MLNEMVHLVDNMIRMTEFTNLFRNTRMVEIRNIDNVGDVDRPKTKRYGRVVVEYLPIARLVMPTSIETIEDIIWLFF